MIISTIIKKTYDTNVNFVLTVKPTKSMFTGGDPFLIFLEGVNGKVLSDKKRMTPKSIYALKLLKL